MQNVQQNIATEIQSIARELIVIKGRLTTITLMWANEGMGALPDEDFAAIGSFAHITAAEFLAAATALAAIDSTLGTNATSNWAKLVKIVDGVPK